MINLNSIMRFLIVFIVAFFGSVFNDFYNTMTDKDEDVKIVRVLLSATTGSILMMASSNYILQYIDYNVFAMLSFIAGVTGFSIFEQFKSIDLCALFWKLIDVAIESREDDDDKS